VSLWVKNSIFGYNNHRFGYTRCFADAQLCIIKTNSEMKIIVTGSLGNIGRPLTTNLVQKGHAVIVISSDPENKGKIEALGATAAIGKLENVDFLTATFTGADAVFTMVPPNYSVPNSRAYYNSIGNSLAQAIQHSGIKHAVNLSSWGAHLAEGTGFIVGAHDVEMILNKLQNVAITHLRAGSIYYNLYNFIDMIKSAGFIGANYGDDDKVVWVAPTDIADAAAEELGKLPVAGSSVRYVASDDRTTNDVAGILGTAIGKPDLKWITFTDEQAKHGMEQQGLPTDIVENLIQLNASIHNGKMREDYDLHAPKPGKVKIEDFAKDFARAYNQK
jgi:uncharacterized protein YbjT (DUF2867 family)